MARRPAGMGAAAQLTGAVADSRTTMCGFCGVFEYGSGLRVDRAQLERMNRTLVHRGPDDEGYFEAPGVGLAVRRLSIIDVAGGHQPMSNEDQTVSIVFNGEIYNFEKLRRDLVQRGHDLRTQSDTEVILHLYEDYGANCVTHLDGMFAFAIFDARASGGDKSGAGRLLLARDRLGKKPLYYADLGGTLVFGSEMKPILQDPRVSRDIDFEALYHYLSLLVVPAPYSILASIRKLLPAHVLETDAAGVRFHRYWNFGDFTKPSHISEEDALPEIRRLVFKAVEKRLVSEVPLGAFLSGGIDSSVVVAVMSRLMPRPVKTFSVGFQDSPSHTELPHARMVADAYRTEHHEFLLSPAEAEGHLHDLTRYADEPLAISSAVPTYLLAKAARSHVTVVLTGDGGDEVFAGYEHYVYERWAAAYRRFPAFIDPAAIWLAGKTVNGGRIAAWQSRALRFIQNARGSPGERRLGWASGWSEEEKRSLLSPDACQVLHLTSPVFLEGRMLHGCESVEALMQMDTLVGLPDEMLAKLDRTTMGASVEGRCPLLDIDLVEFMSGLASDVKLPGARPKHLKGLLRRAVGDLLPPTILNRPKQGFNVPLDTWFRAASRSFVASTLAPDKIRRRGIFDAAVVSNWLSRHWDGSVNASNRIYALLVFEIWAQEYLR